MTSELDGIRENVLEKAEENERLFRILLICAFVIEIVCLVAFAILMDFGNRLHWLILISAVLVYWTLFCGLGALVAELRRNAMRILRAIELLDRDDRGGSRIAD